jgi:uncharacterized membrane protein YjjP (DUF1212 family)
VETEKLLNFTCEMGRCLLRNGAEIYRVEESIHLILKAYGYQQTEIFAIPSCIIINIQGGSRNHNKAIRIKTTANNLHRLNDLNALCREICAETPSMEIANRRLKEIMEGPTYSMPVSYLAHAMVTFFFTLFFGGTLLDALVAVPCGMSVKFVVYHLKSLRANAFFTNLLAAALLTSIPLALIGAGLGVHLDTVIIGSIMLLVPGIAITNVMRDVLSGDFLTAVTRLAEVLIVAMAIAVGVAIPITGARIIGGFFV